MFKGQLLRKKSIKKSFELSNHKSTFCIPLSVGGFMKFCQYKKKSFKAERKSSLCISFEFTTIFGLKQKVAMDGKVC